MVMEGYLIWGGEHTIKYADSVLQNHTPKTYIILLKHATPKDSKQIRKIKNKGKSLSQ